MRVIRSLIGRNREVIGIHVAGRYFDRIDGEPEKELKRRALRVVGWNES
jgi:hypothetical protein